MKFRFCGDLDCPDWLLTEVSTLSTISAMRMKMLCKQVKAIDSVTTDYDKIKQHAKGLENGEVKGSIAAIHFFLTSSAKYNIDSEILLAEIQQLGLPRDVSDALVAHYSENKENIQQSLERATFRKSVLKDVSWRVDEVLASSDDNSERGTHVHLLLDVDNNPHLGDEVGSNEEEVVSIEMGGAKFDVLYKELLEARNLMRQAS